MRKITLILIVFLLLLTGSLLLAKKNSNSSITENPPGSPSIPTPSTPSLALVSTPSPSPSPHPATIPALAQKEYHGSDFRVGKVLAETTTYTRYYITYKSEGLTISGIMNKPKGPGPFPILILNHGYIDPAVYTNGRGLKREQDYLASRGYLVIHPDYRNHAQSSKDPHHDLNFRAGYVEDVINAIKALRSSNLSYLDKENIGMLGHSMGGGITQAILVSQPNLIKAAVLFAPVSATARDNYDKYTRQRPD